MTHIFTLDDVDDFSDKINLDELYEKKKQADLQQLNTFNKILQGFIAVSSLFHVKRRSNIVFLSYLKSLLVFLNMTMLNVLLICSPN
jgi:hypothetical protein